MFHFENLWHVIRSRHCSHPTISSHKVSLVVSLSSDSLNLFFLLLILLFYLPITSYYKVKSTLHGCNHFIFDRIRRKYSMMTNANLCWFRPAVEVSWYIFVRILFQNFSWFFLIELNDVQATKTFKICLQQTVSFSIGIPFIEFPSEN